MSSVDTADPEGASSTEAADKQRRYFLIGATSVVGGIGVVGAAVPFVRSWSPSAKARAAGAPVKIDISKLRPGEMLGPIPAWRGKPIFVVYRTEEALSLLEGQNDTSPVMRPLKQCATGCLGQAADVARTKGKWRTTLI